MASQELAPTIAAVTSGQSHTPGPWFWALDNSDRCTSLMRSGSGDYVICPQADVSDYGLSVSPWNDLSEEDAHLIAAAPELLAALRNLTENIMHAWPSLAHLEPLVVARAAIARAEGLAPSSAEQVVQPIRDEPLSPNTSA